MGTKLNKKNEKRKNINRIFVSMRYKTSSSPNPFRTNKQWRDRMSILHIDIMTYSLRACFKRRQNNIKTYSLMTYFS